MRTMRQVLEAAEARGDGKVRGKKSFAKRLVQWSSGLEKIDAERSPDDLVGILARDLYVGKAVPVAQAQAALESLLDTPLGIDVWPRIIYPLQVAIGRATGVLDPDLEEWAASPQGKKWGM